MIAAETEIFKLSVKPTIGILRKPSAFFITSSERPIDEIDLNDVMENIESDLEILIQKKKAVFQKDKLPIIEGASVLIYQLFYNLINNALKFSKADVPPLITVESAVIGANEKRMAKIVVTDNGIGIHEDHKANIFDMYFGTNKNKGSGLGLYIVKEAVENIKGSISVFSENTIGSKFIVAIPNYHGN